MHLQDSSWRTSSVSLAASVFEILSKTEKHINATENPTAISEGKYQSVKSLKYGRQSGKTVLALVRKFELTCMIAQLRSTFSHRLVFTGVKAVKAVQRISKSRVKVPTVGRVAGPSTHQTVGPGDSALLDVSRGRGAMGSADPHFFRCVPTLCEDLLVHECC